MKRFNGKAICNLGGIGGITKTSIWEGLWFDNGKSSERGIDKFIGIFPNK